MSASPNQTRHSIDLAAHHGTVVRPPESPVAQHHQRRTIPLSLTVAGDVVVTADNGSPTFTNAGTPKSAGWTLTLMGNVGHQQRHD